MNLVLTYCWREWRAQRAMLGGFFGLGIAALCLVFTLVPEHYWLDDGRRALALSWFVVLGGIGVLGFVAPALVRSEYGSKGDQFVRRMPGALRASFGGKLLFLTLTALALPLLGLAAGELFLTANGKGWHDLFRWTFAGDVVFDLPWPMLWIAHAALLIPWVWAIGTWLPNGRMALGGALVFWLVLGLLVRGALHFSPGLQPGLVYEPWIAFASAFGFVAAYASWVVGRRGGGALRSLRCGLLATSIGLLPPVLWLGERTYDYHHPDPECVARLDVTGISPDHRYVLARLQSHASYQYALPFRIDLQEGTATQLHGVGLDLRPELLRPTTFMVVGEARYFSGLRPKVVPRQTAAGEEDAAGAAAGCRHAAGGGGVGQVAGADNAATTAMSAAAVVRRQQAQRRARARLRVPHRGGRRRSRRQRLPWADLLRRVFGIDVLVCPQCAGPRRVLAAIHDPAAIARVFGAMGLTAAGADPSGCRAPPAAQGDAADEGDAAE